MIHQTTTYNNTSNRSLSLAFANGRKAEVRRVLFFLIMMLMGVGSAWGQVCNVVL